MANFCLRGAIPVEMVAMTPVTAMSDSIAMNPYPNISTSREIVESGKIFYALS